MNHTYHSSHRPIVGLALFFLITFLTPAWTSSGDAAAGPFPPGDTCSCAFRIVYNLSNQQLYAHLKPEIPGTPLPNSVHWTVDGEPAGSGTPFFYSFPEARQYVLCAEYTAPDGSACRSCQGIDLSPKCVVPSLIDSNVACLAIFDPVCGCDGKTYGNGCEALYHHGVTSWHSGICNTGNACQDLTVQFEGFNSGGSLTFWTFNGQAQFPGASNFTWHWDFGNGKSSTEQNPSINFFDPGYYLVCLTVQAQGPGGTACSASVCKKMLIGASFSCIDSSRIDLSVPCPAVYDPVCGCDGNTYGNACEALNHHGVTYWTPGACTDACVDSTWKNSLVLCSTVLDPVCGCDGVTYQNDCIALYVNGVTSWKKGPCCANPACRAFFEMSILPNRTVRLDDKSTNAESWALELGDGTVQYGYFDSLIHAYKEPGKYQICLTISNFAGTCTDKYCTYIDFSGSGTGDPTPAVSLTIQPNPAGEVARVSIRNATPKRVLLYGLAGTLIWNRETTASDVDVPVAAFPAGAYLLVVETNAGRVAQKLIVQH